MKIAFTHNLNLNRNEEEAEFDTPETVAFITQTLQKLGHIVEPVEVSGPASRTVARLEALNPDLIFNTAEGKTGRYREAFYPALFDQLDIPFTASDAYTCTLTLDKHLTKAMVREHNIPTPNWQFISSLNDQINHTFQFPVIVKPNFEGSSKGITTKSIVENFEELQNKVKELLNSYPQGLLIEEFIKGRDVTVPYLQEFPGPSDGILLPAEYLFDKKVIGDRKYQIYDFELKNHYSDAVSLRVPADITTSQSEELILFSQKAIRALGIRDLGRIDYRIAENGKIYFIEANALPSLEPGASIYESALKAGYKKQDDIINAVILSASKRYGIEYKLEQIKKRSQKIRVGLTYNMKRIKPELSGEADIEAEYDSPETIAMIKEAIASYGYDVVDLEATQELPSILAASGVDVVFNIAEGIKGRNRESQVPAILELLDIPYTGSDPTTLSLSLDKGLAKRIVSQVGIATPKFFLMTNSRDKFPKDMTFPLIIKPVAEGSSKGVFHASVVHNENDLREKVLAMIDKYAQPVLVEDFLPGREFTVALLGTRRPKVLPPMEIVFLNKIDPFTVYSFSHKQQMSQEIKYEVPANIDKKLARELEKAARICYSALGCRDVSRMDFRLDQSGKVNFIECNPLPGLTKGWSDICMIAESAGMDYRTLIGEILAPTIKRYKDMIKDANRQPKENHS